MDDLISVVVPVYQVENYLERCLNSIINQTYKELEIILVDDGSRDCSGSICDLYQKQDKRIKVIHQQNRGLSAARNSGINIATGQYISFVDADDYIHREMLCILHSELKKNDARISMCLFGKFSGDVSGNCDNVVTESYLTESIDRSRAIKSLFGKESHFMVTACNKLYDRSLFSDVRFPDGKIHEDVATTYKLFSKIENLILVKLNLYCYFQRAGSIMHEMLSAKKIDLYTAYDEMLFFFADEKDIYLLVKKNYIYWLRYYYAKSYLCWNKECADKDEFKNYIKKKFCLIAGRKLYVFDWGGFYVWLMLKTICKNVVSFSHEFRLS